MPCPNWPPWWRTCTTRSTPCTLGHQTGDEALKFLAGHIKQALRPMDTVARYGGEEFVVLLPQTTAEEARVVLTRLQRTLSANFFMHDERQVFVTFTETGLMKDLQNVMPCLRRLNQLGLEISIQPALGPAVPHLRGLAAAPHPPNGGSPRSAGSGDNPADGPHAEIVLRQRGGPEAVGPMR